MAQLDGGSGGGGDSGVSSSTEFGEELGGDPAGDADRTTVDDAEGGLDGSDTQDRTTDDTSTTTSRRLRRDARSDPMSDPTEPEPESTEQFGEELGGDPAGDADRTTEADDGPDPSGVDSGGSDFDPGEHLDGGDTATGPSQPDAGGFGQELGGDPAGDADRTPGPTPDDVADPGTDTPEQGIEEGGATPEVEQQAQDFEQQIVQSTPGVTEEDVSVSLVGTDEGTFLRAEFTEGAESRVQDRLISARRDVVTQAEEDAEVREAIEGLGGGDLLEPTRTAQRDALSDLREEVEGDIEGEIGAGRAERAGITNPTLRENVVGNVDLEAGEDFTIDVRETPGGVITVDAELTEEFTREEATRALERQLRNQFDVDLEAGEDFRVVEGEEGGFQAEFSEQGRGRVNLSTIDRTVRDIERGDIPIFTDATGIRGLRFDVPGEGAVVPAATDTSMLTETGSPVRELPFFGAGPILPQPNIGDGEGPVTLADAGNFLAEQVTSGIEDYGEEGIPGSVTPGIESGPLRRGVAAGVSDFSALLGQGVGLPTRGSQFLAAGAEAQQSGEFGEFTETASVTGQRLPAEFASGQIGRFRDEPVAATGGLVGTLVGSALLMRAFPRTRFLVQPGEEIAGIGGFGLTRRVAGERRAQQLFPNQEPLIFSEEAVLRQARRVREGAPSRLSDTRTRAADTLLGEAEAQVSYDATRVDPIQRSTARPGFGTQARRAAGRVEDAFSGRAFAGIPVPRTELETRSRPSTESETEALMDQLEGPLRRMEESRIREAQRSPRIGGPGRRGPPSEFRGPVVRDRLALETEPAALRRFEIAGQPTTQSISSALAVDVASRDLLSQEPRSFEDELGRSDILADTETDQELRQESRLDFMLESEFDQRFEFEAEAEAEVEFETRVDLETEAELDPLGGRRPQEDEDDPFAEFGESRELLERDLLNPLTGE